MGEVITRSPASSHHQLLRGRGGLDFAAPGRPKQTGAVRTDQMLPRRWRVAALGRPSVPSGSFAPAAAAGALRALGLPGPKAGPLLA